MINCIDTRSWFSYNVCQFSILIIILTVLLQITFHNEERQWNVGIIFFPWTTGVVSVTILNHYKVYAKGLHVLLTSLYFFLPIFIFAGRFHCLRYYTNMYIICQRYMGCPSLLTLSQSNVGGLLVCI